MGILIKNLNNNQSFTPSSPTSQPKRVEPLNLEGLSSELERGSYTSNLPAIYNNWSIEEYEANRGCFNMFNTYFDFEDRYGVGKLALVRQMMPLDGSIFHGIYNRDVCQGIKFLLTGREISFTQPLISVKSIWVYPTKIVVILKGIIVILKTSSNGNKAFPIKWINFGDTECSERDFYPFPPDCFMNTIDFLAVIYVASFASISIDVKLLSWVENQWVSEFDTENEFNHDNDSSSDNEYDGDNDSNNDEDSSSEDDSSSEYDLTRDVGFEWRLFIDAPRELITTSNKNLRSCILRNSFCLYNEAKIWFYPFNFTDFNTSDLFKDRMNSMQHVTFRYNACFNLEILIHRNEVIDKIFDMTNLCPELFLVQTNKKLFSVKLCNRGESVYSDYNLILDGFTPQTQISTSFHGEIILILRRHIYHHSLSIFQWYSRTKTWIMSGCNEVPKISDHSGNRYTLYGNDHHCNLQPDNRRLGYILFQKAIPSYFADYQILDVLAQSH
ncbi:hypothetical protein MOUN0_F04610 [Monosporozyma unispora]|nr:hypothetical protein C6P44_002790 [Kazachstania unispora]